MKVIDVLKKYHPYESQKVIVKFGGNCKETMSRDNVLDMSSIYLEKTVTQFSVENGDFTIYCK